MTTIAYRCSNCGSDNVGVDMSRPSLDDRYAIGRCLTEDAKAKAANRKPKPVQLVRADLFEAQRERRAEQRRIAKRASAAKAAVGGKGNGTATVERMEQGAKVVEELYG